MFKRKEKAFTLIELIATLVIMTIIALIVTPLVMNIIRKARIPADKRSIDAYGRSIELAIASHLLDTGKFATSIDELTIEYSGNKVECETTQLNSDSSVYLAGCTVAGRSIDNYTYGSDKSPSYTAYNVGDEVIYNGVDYYVIKDSGAKESAVTLLKAEPLTVEEVNTYGAGHVNRYTRFSVGTAYNKNGYGGMAYYTSETCGYINNNWVIDGCKTDYAQSEVKYVVDAWKTTKAPAATEARLMIYDEYSDKTAVQQICTESCYNEVTTDYDWMYNNNYWYWLGTSYTDSSSSVWSVNNVGNSVDMSVYSRVGGGGGDVYGAVRPVIVLPKSTLSS